MKNIFNGNEKKNLSAAKSDIQLHSDIPKVIQEYELIVR
jgi:hypothetical protein